jgi:hypothetical protein
MKKYNRGSGIGGLMYSWVFHYNYKKYWFMKRCVVENYSRKSKIIWIVYLVKIKKVGVYNCTFFGIAFDEGAKFKTNPILPHGITGTFISHSADIGENVK